MVYKWYILPIGGLYATYHLLGEPKTAIDLISTIHFDEGDFFRASDTEMRNETRRFGERVLNPNG